MLTRHHLCLEDEEESSESTERPEKRQRMEETATTTVQAESSREATSEFQDNSISHPHLASREELLACGFRREKNQPKSVWSTTEILEADCHCLGCARALADYAPKDGELFRPPTCCFNLESASSSCVRCDLYDYECVEMPSRFHQTMRSFREHAADEKLRATSEFRLLRWRVRRILTRLETVTSFEYVKGEAYQEAQENLQYQRNRDAWQDELFLDMADSLRIIANRHRSRSLRSWMYDNHRGE